MTDRVGPAGRLRAWLVDGPSGAVGLAVVVGVGAGCGAVVFHMIIVGVTWIVTGQVSYGADGRVPSDHLPWLGAWFLVLAPAVGGLAYGPLVYRFAPEARGPGVPEVMAAVAERGGRIAPRVAVVKSLASGLCIGTGGSVGGEGPIVQIGSALGSSIGQWVRASEHRLRLVVACGAAGGISATFDTPLAGVFFALEVILRRFSVEAFGLVAIASVTANVVARGVVGPEHIMDLPEVGPSNAGALVVFVFLGLSSGLVGWAFARVLYLIEDFCDLVWRGPEWLRPAVGGLVLGVLLVVFPEMYGIGYGVLENGIAGTYTVTFLVVLAATKMIATSLTIGIGGSGGVFAPSLFIGGTFGTAFGTVAHLAFPVLVPQPAAMGLVGMAAVFAGAGHAPIAAVVIVLELTGQPALIVPLMIAVVLATGLSSRISRDNIYTLKLLRRGLDIDASLAGTSVKS